MKLTRRNALIGLGTAAAGAGAVAGSGAFSSVTAERTVSVSTTGDAGAALQLAPVSGSGNSEYVDDGDDAIAVNLDDVSNASGFNTDAKTVLSNLIRVTNNGTQEVASLTLEFINLPSFTNGNPFKFTVSEGDDSSGYESTLSNGSDILTENGDIPGNLEVGESVDFGIVIDLIGKGNGNNGLPAQNNGYTLEITAES